MKFRSLVFTLTLTIAGQASGAGLMDVFRLAKDNDATLRAAKADLRAVRLGRSLAQSRLRPSVAVSAETDYIRSEILSPSASETVRRYGAADLSLAFSYPLYHKDFRLELEKAGIETVQAEASYLAQEQALMLRVAEGYFDVLAAEDRRVFANAENTAIARQLERAEKRFQVGLTDITSVHEAQAAHDQSTADLIQAGNAVDDAAEALREMVRSLPGSLNGLADTIPLEPPAPADIEVWAAKAQMDNPGVRAARYAMEIARKQIEVERAGDAPTVDVVARHSIARNTSDNVSDTLDTLIGLQLNVPLYTGGAVTAATEQARHRFEAAQERLDGERRSVDRRVRDAFRGIRTGVSQVQALQAAILSARSALEATQAGSNVGTRTMVDVLNAERDLYRAMSNHATARYGYVLNRIQLRQAVGDLTEEDLTRVDGKDLTRVDGWFRERQYFGTPDLVGAPGLERLSLPAKRGILRPNDGFDLKVSRHLGITKKRVLLTDLN